MSIVDKLTGTKEKAVLGALGPAMRLINDWTTRISNLRMRLLTLLNII